MDEAENKEIWWNFNQFEFKMKCPCMQIDEDRWENFYCFIAITKICLPSSSSTERILAKKKLSCGAREGHMGCRYWISVLTNWFSLEMQLTWSSVNVFLSFCWHNIEVLIGQWWLRMEVMRDSVKNSRLIFLYALLLSSSRFLW